MSHADRAHAEALRVQRGHGRKLVVGAFKREHADFGRRRLDQREMNGVLVAPKAEHGGARIDEFLQGELPGVARDHDARPAIKPILKTSIIVLRISFPFLRRR